jgi:UDP-glucose 4-epimerase
LKFLVTGSSGFVGQKLCASLIKANLEVIGCDLSLVDGVKYRQILGSFNSPEVFEVIDSSTTVIHLAAISTDNDCRADPLKAIKTNIQDLVQLAQFCALQKVPNFIFASSEWVYPETNTAVELYENDRLNLDSLNSLYAMSKLVGENFLRVLGLLNVTCLRFGIVYGPRPLPGSAPESFILNVYNQKQISTGSYSTARRFIFVDDLVEGIHLAAKRIPRGQFEIYNLGGSELISLLDILKLAEQITQQDADHEELGSKSSIRNPISTKFQLEFNWHPKIPIEVGLELCLNKMTNSHKS